MADFIVRKMRVDDLDGVMRIEEASFAVPWSRESMLGEANNKAAHYLVAEREGEILGYGGAWLVIDEAHITNIAVAPHARRMGVARAILNRLIEEFRSVDIRYALLEVRVSNKPAQALYKGFGFKVLSVRRKYYADNGEDAYVMLLEIPPAAE